MIGRVDRTTVWMMIRVATSERGGGMTVETDVWWGTLQLVLEERHGFKDEVVDRATA